MRANRFRALIVTSVVVSMAAMSIPAANAAPGTVLSKADEALADDFPGAEDLKDRAIMEPLVQALSEATGDEGGTVAIIDGKPNGFASFIVDNARHRIDLYWVGRIPTSVQRIIEAHPGVDVALHSARYSLPAMLRATDAVSEGYHKLEGDNGTLFTVGPDREGRGIKVRVSTLADVVDRERVEQAVSQLTDVKLASVEIGAQQSLNPFSGGRQSDESPHYGGAQIQITTSSGGNARWCTTGASVEGLGTGNKYMTTSIHCMEKLGLPDHEIDSEGKVYNAAGVFIGTWKWTAGQLQKDRHAILIKLKSGSTNSGRAYWGANSSASNLPVDGITTSPLGDSVCAHGANTGAHCGGTVTDKNFTLMHGTVSIKGMVEAVHPTSLMAGSGDSGGPVSIVKSNGKRPIAGFVLGAPWYTSSPAACGSSAWIPGSECSKTLWYTGGMSGYLDALNVKLR